MNQRIITASEIRAWKNCPKRWWFRYGQELVPNKTQIPLSYGRLAHQGLEAYYHGRDPCEAVDQFFRENTTPWPEDQELFVLAEANSLLAGYIKRDPVKEMGHEIVAIEKEGRLPLRTPGGRRWHHFLLGYKIDLITRDRFGNLWAWDHKTSAMALKEAWLPLNDQMAYYYWALGQQKELPQGIIYNLIRKPSIKPRQNEPSDEWGARLAADIEKRPEFYYQNPTNCSGSLIVKNEHELAATEAELWDIAHRIGCGVIHRNPSSCQIMACAYNEICRNDTSLARSAGYKHERVHVELEEVVNVD